MSMPDDVQSPQPQPQPTDKVYSSDPTPSDHQLPRTSSSRLLRERALKAKVEALTKSVAMLRHRLSARARLLESQEEDIAGLRLKLATEERWEANLQLADKLQQQQRDPPGAEAEIKQWKDDLAMEQRLTAYLQEENRQIREKQLWTDQLMANTSLTAGMRIIAYYAWREMDLRHAERRLDGSIPIDMERLRLTKPKEAGSRSTTPGVLLGQLVEMGALVRSIEHIGRARTPTEDKDAGAKGKGKNNTKKPTDVQEEAKPAGLEDKPEAAEVGPLYGPGKLVSIAPGALFSQPEHWQPIKQGKGSGTEQPNNIAPEISSDTPTA